MDRPGIAGWKARFRPSAIVVNITPVIAAALPGGPAISAEDGTGLTRRNMLRGLGIMAAAAPAGVALPVAGAEIPGAPIAAPLAELLDEHLTSSSGRHFNSQLIHSGEQAGHQVTPISQDKCAPGGAAAMETRLPTVSPFRQ